MTAEPWSDEDRPPPPKRWRWWHVATLVAVVLLAVCAAVMFAFSEKLVGGWHDWQVRQFRNDILSGNLPPEALRDELLKRDDGHYLAVRLSEDEDPRVRAAVIDRLVARASPAQRQPDDVGIVGGGTGLEAGGEDALKRLIDDPDPAVRKKAIRAVCGFYVVTSFREELGRILESGPVEERLIVCEYLAHWNGTAVRRTFADPRQPKEVRLAALRSADRYGWARLLDDEADFVRTMKRVQAEGDPVLRQAATDALRHSRTAKPPE